MQGSAAFFAPLMWTVPRRGSPPRMTNLSMKMSPPVIVAAFGAGDADGEGTGGQGPAVHRSAGTPLSEGAKGGAGPGKTDASVLAMLASEWQASATGARCSPA